MEIEFKLSFGGNKADKKSGKLEQTVAATNSPKPREELSRISMEDYVTYGKLIVRGLVIGPNQANDIKLATYRNYLDDKRGQSPYTENEGEGVKVLQFDRTKFQERVPDVFPYQAMSGETSEKSSSSTNYSDTQKKETEFAAQVQGIVQEQAKAGNGPNWGFINEEQRKSGNIGPNRLTYEISNSRIFSRTTEGIIQVALREPAPGAIYLDMNRPVDGNSMLMDVDAEGSLPFLYEFHDVIKKIASSK